MVRRVIAKQIAEVPMFAVCNKRELQLLSKLATELAVPAGERLTIEGEPGQEFMILLSGTATVTKNGRKIGALGPGDYFGEIAILDPGLRTATVTADTDVMVAVLAPADFGQALDEVPALAGKVMRGLARRIREIDPVIIE